MSVLHLLPLFLISHLILIPVNSYSAPGSHHLVCVYRYKQGNNVVPMECDDIYTNDASIKKLKWFYNVPMDGTCFTGETQPDSWYTENYVTAPLPRSMKIMDAGLGVGITVEYFHSKTCDPTTLAKSSNYASADPSICIENSDLYPTPCFLVPCDSNPCGLYREIRVGVSTTECTSSELPKVAFDCGRGSMTTDAFECKGGIGEAWPVDSGGYESVGPSANGGGERYKYYCDGMFTPSPTPSPTVPITPSPTSYTTFDEIYYEDYTSGAALFYLLLVLGSWVVFYALIRFRCACDQGRHNFKVASSDFAQRDGQNTVFEGMAWKTEAHPADKNWGIVFFLLVTAALTFLEIMYTLANELCFFLDDVPILVIVCYGIYLEVCRQSGVYKSFLHMLPKEKVEKYMVKVNEERVKISFHIVCSHTETRQVSDGNGGTKTESHTVVTYDETVGLDYGECVNHEKNATGINRGHYDVILCKTIPVIRYENGKSDEESLQRYKNKLHEENKHRDTNCSVSMHDCLDSLEPMQMIKYTDSCMLTKGTFEIFAYALLGWFYIWWVRSKAGQCEIVVIKTLKDVARWERGGGGGGGGEKSPVTSNSGVAIEMMPMQGGMMQGGTPTIGMQPGMQSGMQPMPMMMQPGMIPTLQQQQVNFQSAPQLQQMNQQPIFQQTMQQPMFQPPVYDPTVPMITVKVPIYGGGGSVTSEYNGKLVMVEIPKDATPGADIMVPVPEGYR